MVYTVEEMFDFNKPYVNHNVPCKCCRDECISVGAGYCRTHYMELLTQVILGKEIKVGKGKPPYGNRQISKQRDENSAIS